jgi:cell division protein FtsL
MATAYRWNEEYPQGLKPGVVETRLARLKPRTAVPPANLGTTVREDESGASVEKRKIVPARNVGGVRSRFCKKPAMVEFHTVKRIDNSRLQRRIEPVKLRSLYRTVVLGGLLAAFCMIYVYQHFRCIDLSFQLEDLKSKQVQAQSLNSELKLEIETLRDPARIDRIAQEQLGLKRLESAQMRDYGNVDGSQVAAMQVRSAVSSR